MSIGFKTLTRPGHQTARASVIGISRRRDYLSDDRPLASQHIVHCDDVSVWPCNARRIRLACVISIAIFLSSAVVEGTLGG